MGKTYKSVRPNPEFDIPAGRMVKESTARTFVRALKKIKHHRERRYAHRIIAGALKEAV
jgi:hypothetical protein